MRVTGWQVLVRLTECDAASRVACLLLKTAKVNHVTVLPAKYCSTNAAYIAEFSHVGESHFVSHECRLGRCGMQCKCPSPSPQTTQHNRAKDAALILGMATTVIPALATTPHPHVANHRCCSVMAQMTRASRSICARVVRRYDQRLCHHKTHHHIASSSSSNSSSSMPFRLRLLVYPYLEMS